VKKLLVGSVVVAALSITSVGAAFAGEVTGNGKPTPIKTRGVAASACAFSGVEDGLMLIGFGPMGPIFELVPSGPGRTQTPHAEADIVHEPGVAGQACRGNAGTIE
jgi:hypothetical protein